MAAYIYLADGMPARVDGDRMFSPELEKGKSKAPTPPLVEKRAHHCYKAVTAILDGSRA